MRKCAENLTSLDKSLDEARTLLKEKVTEKRLPSNWFHVSRMNKEKLDYIMVKQKRNLENLSAIQDTPSWTREVFSRF